MVKDVLSKGESGFKASGFAGHEPGDPDGLSIFMPLLIDSEGAYFTPAVEDWKNESILVSLLSVFNTETLAKFVFRKASGSLLPHQYGALIPISPPKPILQGQNVVVIGKNLLKLVEDLDHQRADLCFSEAFDLSNDSKAKLATREEFEQLAHENYSCCIKGF